MVAGGFEVKAGRAARIADFGLRIAEWKYWPFDRLRVYAALRGGRSNHG